MPFVAQTRSLARLRGAALFAVALACAPPPVPRPVARSSTIVLDATGTRLFVTSPDDDVVVTVSTADGAELGRAVIPAGPEELAWVDGTLVVTRARAASVALTDGSTLLGAISVPCGSTRSVVSLAGRTFVSCPDDDRIVELDVPGRAVVAVREVAGGPAGLALFGDELGVALSRRGALATIDLSGEAALETAPISERVLETTPGHAASNAAFVSADPIAGFSILFQRVDHDSDRDRDPARGGYGSVVDGSPRIEPRLSSACGDRYARFDGGARAMSGPSALASAGGHVWITNLQTDDVLLAHCDVDGSDPRAGELDVWTTFGVGRAPRGIALTADGHTAFVDDGWDWAVSRLDAPSTAASRTAPTWTVRRTLGAHAMSDAALEGRSLFFDAVDTHLTPSGVVTCGTCHPRGGDDGLSWFLHTSGVPRKLRRTPPAWAARPAFAPFHWDGEFTDVAVLARGTTENLMEGDGLLVDFAAIAAYLAEVPPPPPRPADSDDETAARARGLALFASAGCEACHTDGGAGVDGATHSVIPDGSDLDANLAAVETPPLVGVRARAPYFHDGRAPTLRDTLVIPDDRHGLTSALSAAELDDLLAYLESL